MELDITNFLLKYPNINQFEDDILNPYEEDFYEAIYKKKEFYDVRLEEFEQVPDKVGTLMNHQKLISRFLSSNTLYDELLLLHEMGSGKTCSAVGAIEQIRQEGKFKGALYLAKGDALINNFMNELIFKCTDGRYIPDGYTDLSELKKVHRTRKAIEDYYKTNTFETFAKKIKSYTTNRELSKWCQEENFNNNVIIIDEVHNLRMKAQIEEDGKQTNINVYKEFYRFLHIVKDCKILLMSGTPMKDGVEEIASVMNLILPPTDNLPTGSEFVNNFFDKKGYILSVKQSAITTLKKAFKGRVSYLKSMRSSVEKVFQRNGRDKTLKQMIVFGDEMSEFQTMYYEIAYQRDGGQNKGVWANSRQASLFVFPDGSFGKDGFDKYIEKKAVKSVVEEGKAKKTKYSYSLSSKLIDEIIKPGEKETEANMLENIRRFSSKYASSIAIILDAREKDKSVFVYNEFVTGSGLILFGLLLQLFGFSKARGVEKTAKYRYATLTSQTSTDKEIGLIVDRFNKPDNMHGKIINVIIGSRKISEGFTFKNVQIVDIHTPWFNYSETSQVIARGHRLGSHKDLIDNGIDPSLNIYQRVSFPRNRMNSIDLDMYKMSENKDISIKGVERIIKESAWDCALSYNRNLVTGFDNKRECDYTDCEYTCDGILGTPPNEPFELDHSTFNSYYDEQHIKLIIDRVTVLFSEHFRLDIDTLTDNYFQEFSKFEVVSALRLMINESKRIINKYGFPSYLKENNNIFFLVDSLSGLSTDYYTEHPHSNILTTFDEVIIPLYNASLPEIIYLVKDARVLEDIRKIMIRLPEKVQEYFIESSIQRTLIGLDDPENPEIKIANLILKYFENSFKKINDVWVSNHIQDNLRCFDEKVGSWEDCDDKYLEIIEKQGEQFQKWLENSPYGYYGLYNPTTKLFCLRNVKDKSILTGRGHKKTSGQVCTTFNHEEFMSNILDIWKLPIPNLEEIELIQDDLDVKMPKMIKIREKIDTMKKEQIIKEIQRKSTVKNRPHIMSETEQELKRIMFWGYQTKEDICSYLHSWFKNNKYYIVNDSCGASNKPKPK